LTYSQTINFWARQSCSAWGVSTLVHAGILILLWNYYWQNLGVEPKGLIVTVSPENRIEDFSPTITSVINQQTIGGTKFELPVNREVREPVTDVEIEEITIEQPVLMLTENMPIYETSELTAYVKANIKDLAGLKFLAGLDQGDGANGVGQGGGTFLPTAPTYRRIVYVVDASRSMNHPHESPALTRIGRVKIELLRSIESLQPHQEFFVIFFTEFAHPMPSKRGFITRSSTELNEYLTWMAKHIANGNTDPRLALQMAFNMEPEVIYFLTDGEVNPIIARDIIGFNQKKVKINTVCIGSAPSEHLMQQIALKHQGIYSFVP
jgi:hypothetical protein